MRLIRKLVILGLAALGAYRLYELVQAQAGQVRATAGPPVNDAIDTVKTTANKVKDDLTEAQVDLVEDLNLAVGRTDAGTPDGASSVAAAGEPPIRPDGV